MARYHTIFFDVGGTLIHPKPSVGAVYAEVAARYDIEIDADHVEQTAREIFGRKKEEGLVKVSHHTAPIEAAKAWWREIVRESFGSAAESPRFEACYQALFEEFAHADRYAFFPEAEGVFRALEQRGYRMGLISNWDARLRPVLEEFGVVTRFDPVVISCEVGAEKPDPRIFEIAREQAGAGRGDRLLHLGDNAIEDVEAARAVGFEARLIDRSAGDTLESVLRDVLDAAE